MLAKLQDTKTPFKKISIFLDNWVQKNFKTQGQMVGGWEPFKIGGRWIKGKGLDTGAKLLQDTGRLRASFLPFASKNDAGIGSDLPYSKIHQEGKGVPKRRVLPQKGEVFDDAKKILENHVIKSIK